MTEEMWPLTAGREGGLVNNSSRDAEHSSLSHWQCLHAGKRKGNVTSETKMMTLWFSTWSLCFSVTVPLGTGCVTKWARILPMISNPVTSQPSHWCECQRGRSCPFHSFIQPPSTIISEAFIYRFFIPWTTENIDINPLKTSRHVSYPRRQGRSCGWWIHICSLPHMCSFLCLKARHFPSPNSSADASTREQKTSHEWVKNISLQRPLKAQTNT